MIPKHTLIAFHCNLGHVQDKLGEPTDLGRMLESTKEHRVEIYRGAYVFHTQKGWQDMHRLCEFLRIHRDSFVRLPFEEELFVYTTPAIAKALREMEVKIYPYPEVV